MVDNPTPSPSPCNGEGNEIPPVRIEDVARVSLGARVVCIDDGMTGTVADPRLQGEGEAARVLIDLDGPRWPRRRWVPVAQWRLTYDPASMASMLRFAFDVYGLAHVDLVRLRHKIEGAYKSQFPMPKEGHDPVEVAAIAGVVLARLAAGQSVKQILKLSRGKLCKLARPHPLAPSPYTERGN